jgi:hypothetical protein
MDTINTSFFIFTLVVIGINIKKIISIQNYNKSDYKKISGVSHKEIVNNKGFIGEYNLFNELNKIDTPILTNVYIPKSDGKTTEIDIVLLHGTGIYVFENKNYSGTVYGEENDKQWTQHIRRRNYKFMNPIIQNKYHIKHLKEYLGIEDDNVFKSIIVFSDECNISKINIFNENRVIIKSSDAMINIFRMLRNGEMVITGEQKRDIYSKLEKCTKVSEDIKINHIKYLKEKQKNN